MVKMNQTKENVTAEKSGDEIKDRRSSSVGKKGKSALKKMGTMADLQMVLPAEEKVDENGTVHLSYKQGRYNID